MNGASDHPPCLIVALTRAIRRSAVSVNLQELLAEAADASNPQSAPVQASQLFNVSEWVHSDGHALRSST
jgi:hypothetical protein